MSRPAWEDVEQTFRSSVVRIAGPEARQWLTALPALEADICTLWRLESRNELRGGSLALTRLVRLQDGSDAVLKLAGPWDRPADEIASLRAWNAGPAPRLLEANAARGAMLLERVTPGSTPVETHAKDVASLLARLHVPAPPGMPPLGEIVRRRIEQAACEGRVSPPRLAWARETLGRLEAQEEPAVLVHGDFDERNLLLCARRGLCAIDPLPCAGDALYDAAYWIHANRRRGRRVRFDSLAVELGLDDDRRARLRDWCGIVAVHG